MKKFLLALCFSVASFALHAQVYNSPESVEYDSANQRWFVSQNGSGEIHTLSPGSGTLTLFAGGLSNGPHGLVILGDTLYACDGGRVRGYDLTTGTQVFNVNLNATFLNGITSDGGHFLFVTDFSAKKIYRVNTLTNSYNLMASTIKTPNGIYYDGANNRCVFVTWGANAAIQAMSLNDSTISTLLPTTLGSMDGITRDLAGFWYFTTWSNNSLNRVDPTFSSSSTVVMSSLSSPADIHINAAGDSIGIPNSGNANNVVFYTGITTGIQNTSGFVANVFPNPSTERVRIDFGQQETNLLVRMTDAQGKLIWEKTVSGTSIEIPRNGLAAGTYFIQFKNSAGIVRGQTPLVFVD
ncbi:MAG: T9SS type A sorting domain-containing protein [Bacteroidia bacterium]